MTQRMLLPLTVSCFSIIQIGFTFLVPSHPGSPGQRAVKYVCVCVNLSDFLETVGLSDDACRGSDVNVCRAEGRDDSVMCTVG